MFAPPQYFFVGTPLPITKHTKPVTIQKETLAPLTKPNNAIRKSVKPTSKPKRKADIMCQSKRIEVDRGGDKEDFIRNIAL